VSLEARQSPVFCVGAGAIGSLIGARLASAGIPAVLVGRGRHVGAIRRNGVTVDESALGRGRRVVPVPAYDSLAEALQAEGQPSSVLLTVKAYDAEPAIGEVSALLPARTAPHCLLVCLQNGLGVEETASGRFGLSRVVAGAITLSVERPEPGSLRLLTDHGGIALSPLAPSGGRPRTALAALAASLSAAGFRVRTYPRFDSVKWSKVILNLWANATSAVFDVSPARVVASPALFAIDWRAFREATNVMRRARIPPVDLPGYPVRLLVLLASVLPQEAFRRLVGPKVVGGRGGKMPSFWLDLERGRKRSEVSFLNGAIASAGDRLGVATPVNRVLTGALMDIVSGEVPRGRYIPMRDDPDRLLAL